MYRCSTFAAALACALACAPAHALRPGDLVTGFGSQGFVRIGWNRSGESPFDSAHFVATRYEGSGVLRFPYVYVAGVAGDRAGLIKLDGNGLPVAGFGDNGFVTSTQYGLGRLAGLGFAPNGDIVLAYGTRAAEDPWVHAQSEDFFVEVFDTNGQPRIQQTVLQFGSVPMPVNWVGVNVVRPGDGNFCDPDDYSVSATARSMAQAANGNLAVAGVVEHASLRSEFASQQETVVARFWFDAGAGVYRVWNDGNLYPIGNPADSCMTVGSFGYYVPGDQNTYAALQWADAAAYLTPDDLRVAGPIGNPDTDPPGVFRRYGGYHALRASADLHADPDGSAWVGGGYWGADARNTEFHAMQWVPERPNLFLYGTAEDGTFAGGTKLKPIVAFDSGSNVLTPRWAFLNSEMSATYSASANHGIHYRGKHILLGTLRLCAQINDCTGDWNGFFVSRTAGEPDFLAYPPDHGFGDDGSRYYDVKGSNGIPAVRSWAWHGAVLEARTLLPGEEPSSDLIVVGDFRYFESTDETDYDWFVARIRLRGTDGSVSVTVTGDGSVSGGGLACPGTCSAGFAADTEFVLTATPGSGGSIAGWSGDCEPISPTQCRVHVDGSQTVAVAFGGDRIFADGFEAAP